MSLLEVNKITPQSGTTLTLGDTGDTINFGSGVLPNFENLTVTGDLTVDTNSLYVDSTNNYVGIGTASPSSPLTINRSIDGDLIEFETSGTIVAKISSASGRALVFDADPVPGGAVATTMQFRVDNSEAMRIDSSGNLLVGQTTTTVPGSGNTIAGMSFRGENGAFISRTTAGSVATLTVNRDASDGVIQLFMRGGTEIGSVGVTNTNNLYIQGDSTNSGLQCGTNTILPVQNGSNTDNTIDLGASSLRWKDLYLAGTISNDGTGGMSIDTSGNVVFNESGSNSSFRIESDTQPNAFLLDGATGNIGIGTSTVSSFTGYTSLSINNGTNGGLLELQNSGTTYGQVFTDGTNFNIRSGALSTALVFDTNGANERMRIDNSGNVGIGTTTIPELLTANRSSNGGIVGFSINNDYPTASTASAGTGSGIRFGVNDGSFTSAFGDARGSEILSVTQQSNGRSRDFVFKTDNAGTFSEVMRLTSAGYLGIGTTSPSTLIDLAAGATATAGGSIAGITMTNRYDSPDNSYSIKPNRPGVSNTGLSIRDETDSRTDMAFDGAGNVGIGTMSPSKELHVYASSGESAIQVEAAAGDAGINLKGYSTSASFVNFGDESTINVGQIYYSHPGNAMQFKTNATERMRIDSGGSLLHGTTSNSAPNGNGGTLLQKNSSGSYVQISKTTTEPVPAMEFYNPNGRVGQIIPSGTSTSYVTSSDHRLKENVVEMTGATDRLKQLSPKRFNFIADADTTVDGFLAHEVSDIVPEAISGTKDEVDADGNPIYQGIDQSKLVPLLVATIKELEARIEALENA